jgi:hypothetical protein
MVASMYLVVALCFNTSCDVEYLPVSNISQCEAMGSRLAAQLEATHFRTQYFCTDMPDIFGD